MKTYKYKIKEYVIREVDVYVEANSQREANKKLREFDYYAENEGNWGDVEKVTILERKRNTQS